MKKLIFALFLLASAGTAQAAGGGAKLDPANVDLSDQASLQHGAKLFMNYCLNCHSLQYQRYQRMADDIGLTYEEVEDNMIFGNHKIGDLMTVAMSAEDATRWFGAPPPDLSVIARARGADWLYTYLRSFYVDPKRPFGVNNTVFPDVGMPHVLWELQGMQKALFNETKDAGGNPHKEFAGFESVSSGSMDPGEYDNAVRDLTAFLVYVGEPIQMERKRLGVYVILFLLVFTVLAYLMKKEYWKDVH
ncbi:MAG: cytochrome c1 [Gammaproteobacteria bacterium SHHR-1]